MALRRLPFELQALLLHLPAYRLAPLSSTYSSVSTWPRCISLPTVESSARSHSSFVVASSLLDDVPTGPGIFEDASIEYNSAPLSTLDFPRTAPRSNDDALLALLEAGDLVGAESLRKDLVDSAQPIPPRFEFSSHAEKMHKDDSGSKNWINWWSLAPSIHSARDLVGEDPRTFRREIRKMDVRAKRILYRLLSEISSIEGGDWDRLTTFGLVLAEQGLVRGVSEKLLVHAAAYAPFDKSEALWNASIDALRRSWLELPPSARRLRHSTQQQLAAYSKGKMRAVDDADAPLQADAYVATRLRDDFRWLVFRRAGMIRAHSNLGRFDLVAQLLEDLGRTQNLTSEPLTIPKKNYIPLLAETAEANRFDVFDRIHADLERNGGRLLPFRSAKHRKRTPYHIRSVDSPSMQALDAVSPQEAFSTYRYSTHVGAFEEGEQDLGSPLQAKLETALADEDIDSAARAITSMLGAGDYPPTHLVADFLCVALASERSSSIAFVQALDEYFRIGPGGVSKRLGAYWTSTKMLAHLHRSEPQQALGVFCSTFSLDGVPRSFRRAFSTSVRSATLLSSPQSPYRLPLNSGAFRLACEALIANLEQSESHATTLELYHSLVHEPAMMIPPRPKGLGALLDASTFTPFLLSFRKRQDPLELLRVLDVMWTKLRLRPTKHQIGIVLGAFARWAEPSELFHVLDVLGGEGRGDQVGVRKEVLEMIGRVGQAIDEDKRGLGVASWTTMIVGLTKQKQPGAAQEVVRRMERDGGYGTQWNEDEQLRQAMVALVQEGGAA